MGQKGGPGDEGPVGKKGDKVLHTTYVWGGRGHGCAWACMKLVYNFVLGEGF